MDLSPEGRKRVLDDYRDVQETRIRRAEDESNFELSAQIKVEMEAFISNFIQNGEKLDKARAIQATLPSPEVARLQLAAAQARADANMAKAGVSLMFSLIMFFGFICMCLFIFICLHRA